MQCLCRQMWRSTIDPVPWQQNGDSFVPTKMVSSDSSLHIFFFFRSPSFAFYVIGYKAFYTSLSEYTHYLYSTNCSVSCRWAHSMSAFGATNWTSMMQHFSSFTFISFSLSLSFPFQFFYAIFPWSLCTILFIVFPSILHIYNFYSLYFHIFLPLTTIDPTIPSIHSHRDIHWIPSEPFLLRNKWYVNTMFIT